MKTIQVSYYGRNYRATVVAEKKKTVTVRFATKGDQAAGTSREKQVHVLEHVIATKELLDEITKRTTCFSDFWHMVTETDPGYRPTIHPLDCWDWLLVAAYNTAQKYRKDERRAFPDNGQSELCHSQIRAYIRHFAQERAA